MRGTPDGKKRVIISNFTRRALVVLASQEKLSRVREALSAAGIRSAVRIRGGARGAERAHSGISGVRPDALYQYTVYVHRNDFERARAAMGPALRNG